MFFPLIDGAGSKWRWEKQLWGDYTEDNHFNET